MSLLMTVPNVIEIKEGVWSFEMPPHRVRHFGNTSPAIGMQSVIVFSSHNFERDRGRLQFDVDGATTINVGTTSCVIGIAAEVSQEISNDAGHRQPMRQAFGPGDNEFLRLSRLELSPAMAETAERLLSAIRNFSSGDLKRGKTRNFSETPDNFWYVIVQPRVNELSITVRGKVEFFKSLSKLEIKDDRGNTRFKVRGEHDLQDALTLITRAKRK